MFKSYRYRDAWLDKFNPIARMAQGGVKLASIEDVVWKIRDQEQNSLNEKRKIQFSLKTRYNGKHLEMKYKND